MKTSVLVCSLSLIYLCSSVSVALAARVDDTNLNEAVTSGNIAMAENALNSGANIEVLFENNSTPLMMARAKGDGAMVELLIKRGAKPTGITPIMIATMKSDYDALKVLVKNKKNLNAIDDCRENALHYAVRAKSLKVVELLLKSGIDVNLKNEMSLTPLMLAVESGSKQMIDMLVDYKAVVNAQDINGETPIYIASCKGNLEAVVTLISRGAGVNILDKEDNSPLSLAIAYKEGYSTRDDEESKAKTITYAAIAKVLRSAGAIESGEHSTAN